ncbi:MAG TPA: EpsI family protein [Pyrinomonadaceae bacterium]|nr:EpsI family protein [Pyrinomonadaceae bacterium]
MTAELATNNSKVERWRFGIFLSLMVIGGLFVNTWTYLGEAHVERKHLKDFPKQISSWNQTGTDDEIDDKTMAVLRASDYLLRDYRSSDGRVLNFYVGYYASQRDGATYHSPLNCLPGSGWVMSDPDRVTVTPKGRPSFVANKYVIQNGYHKEVLLYWYQGRGRAIASEYWGKVYTVIDSVRRRRSDGAMIRITTPIQESEDAALKASIALASETSTILPEFIPD